MPYKSIDDLPETVRNHLPRHGQEIFQRAFNNAAREYDSEEIAFRVAWHAVKEKYEKNSRTGRWQAKD